MWSVFIWPFTFFLRHLFFSSCVLWQQSPPRDAYYKQSHSAWSEVCDLAGLSQVAYTSLDWNSGEFEKPLTSSQSCTSCSMVRRCQGLPGAPSPWNSLSLSTALVVYYFLIVILLPYKKRAYYVSNTFPKVTVIALLLLAFCLCLKTQPWPFICQSLFVAAEGGNGAFVGAELAN